jgi:hypothetical protein
MKMEQQVCSLELAKRLKELGITTHSEFWWIKEKHHDTTCLTWYADNEYIDVIDYFRYESMDVYDIFPAFTVAELGEMLPRYCELTFRNRADDRKQIRWNCDNQFNETEEATEADARAKLLIYLIENKLITLP